MSFHSVIYEELKLRSVEVALSFKTDYKGFVQRRSMSMQFGTFESVNAYFYAVFSNDPAKYQRELRCITGNRLVSLWLDDFRGVVADTYARDRQHIAINTHGNSNTLISELGGLLGSE